MTDAKEAAASVREAALREAAATKLTVRARDGERAGVFGREVELPIVWQRAILALIAQPSAPAEQDVPALTLERVRAVLLNHRHVTKANTSVCCSCGNNTPTIYSLRLQQWVEHILALLAAPETEKP